MIDQKHRLSAFSSVERAIPHQEADSSAPAGGPGPGKPIDAQPQSMRETIYPIPAISRRHFIAAAGLTAATAMLGRPAFASNDGIVDAIKNEAAIGKITIVPLRGNVSVLMGSGGNIAVLPGRDGKLLTDALASISNDPIKQLVNTHWHFDHTDGNNWLHGAGASILAHQNTRKRLSISHRVQGWSFTFPPAPIGALPTAVFKKDLTLYMNGARIELDYYEPAHTDSDISVHFTDADILHVADTFWNGFYPFIDYSSGGNIDGTIDAAEANIARATEKTIIIPGHGPIGNKADLIEFRDMLVAIRQKVGALKEAGKSLTQVLAAKPTADFDDKWGRFVTTPDAFTKLVYQGV